GSERFLCLLDQPKQGNQYLESGKRKTKCPCIIYHRCGEVLTPVQWLIEMKWLFVHQTNRA
ncbi:hypothetical protein DVA81_18905, partial [Acinetobacter baumannii]